MEKNFDEWGDNFINRQKELYKNFKPCFCPILQSYIYFNSDGLNHLFYKKRRPRNFKERIYRASLIKYINPVIKKTRKITKEFENNNKFIILIHSFDNYIYGKQVVKVVLIEKNNGKIYFLSVMRDKI